MDIAQTDICLGQKRMIDWSRAQVKAHRKRGRNVIKLWVFGVRLLTALFVLLAVINFARAQEPPRTVKTLKIQQGRPEETALYKIEVDGTVKIDWETVETLASTKADRTISPFAEVMLAIRDKTWKPMR